MYHKLQSWYTVLKSFAARFWDMEHNRQFFVWSTTDNFLSFRAIFRPFIPLNTWKIKILKLWKKKKKKKKKKKPGNISILYISSINEVHMMYGSWAIRQDRFLLLWVIFFPFDTPDNPKKSKFWKNKKISRRCYQSFYTCVPQITIWCMVPNI